VRHYFIDMLKAIFYCHQCVEVVHRDIKPENIVLNHNDEAVLIDFGLSALQTKFKEFASKTKIGTFLFYSPEMFTQTPGQDSSWE